MPVLKRNMEGMLRYSQEEFAEFKRTGDVVFLQQAGEKLFSAVENYISLKSKVRVESYYEAMQLAKGDRELRNLLYDAKILHQFFYNGESEMRAEDIEPRYRKVLARLQARIKNAGVRGWV